MRSVVAQQKRKTTFHPNVSLISLTPQDLPVIPCCYKCNHDFSLDEEYVSCMIDCMKAGTASPTLVEREKTRKSLLHNPKLQERISSQIRDFGGALLYDIEKERFEKVF